MTIASEHGETPWGRYFVEALEGFDGSGRLSGDANAGMVASIAFEGRSALAKVQGRSSPWYKVRIDFPPLGARSVKKLRAIIEAEPFLLARLKSGELPEELLDRIKQNDIDLIPRSWSSMRPSCGCPDRGELCEHMIAAYYRIARELDRDPRILFKLRGVDLAELAGGPSADVEMTLPPPIPLKLEALPRPEAPELPPEPRRLGNYLGLVQSLIPPRSPFDGGDFGAALIEFYHRAALLDPGAADGKPLAGEGGGEVGGLERRLSSALFSVEYEGRERGEAFVLGDRSSLRVIALEGGGARREMGVSEAVSLFLGFEDERGSPGYRFLFHLSRLVRSAWRASAFVPAPALDGAASRLCVVWTPLPAAGELIRALDELGRYDPGIFHVGGPGKPARALSGASAARALAAHCLGEWVRACGFRPSDERAALLPLVELFFARGSLDIAKAGDRTMPRAIASWLSVFNLDFRSSAYRYRLTVSPADGLRDGSRFSLGMSARKAAGGGKRPKAVPLMDAAKEAGGIEALRIPAALSAYVPEIRRLASDRSVLLEESRLMAFLGDAASLLERLGVEVVLPKAMRKELLPRIVLKAWSKNQRSLRSYLDLDTVLEYDWRVAIGDQLLTVPDFERLVREQDEIVAFKDRFVRLDPAEVARLIERARSKPTALELLAARLSGDAIFSADAETVAASLFEPSDEALPAALEARLRPYQERGYRWAMANLDAGFGCVLADDMGLGKTVQAIAVIARLAERGQLADGALVVAPAALLTNWERELARFAPSLSAARYHGPGRNLGAPAQVLVTTYDTASRDAQRLSAKGFSLLICDEAQLMKNAEAKRSRGVKSIKAARRLALSGTPVENRLEDLRSIFDFVLPGYLGGANEFRRTWRERIELDRDREAAEKLRRITSPFLLRRLKTDRDIVPDLPDKIVSNEYASLMPDQAALYESVARAALAEAEVAEPGFERASIVLKLLTALKQVCDHPRVYDKESPCEAGLSGKCLLLVELLREMLDRREKVLVFSQYVEALELLETIIAGELGEACLLYHGGMSKKARDAAVDSFQNDGAARVMLVSLKAGGLGLNLTAASRVIHYDLWYNPAVEDQATDRAFRIGQTKDVFVHRLIVAGSFEERIDAMIKAKRELADMSVSAGESWIARMSMDELRGLFAR
jgi:superfamily II DNA or RNA helicase